MKRNTKKNQKSQKFDVARDIVVKKILEQLEQGIIPWKKPWFGMSRCYNYVTGYCYNIINDMILDEAGGYVTWGKLKELCGEMKDGCDYHELKKQVVMCWTKEVPVKDEDGNEVIEDGKVKMRKVRGLRYENVVNVKYTTLPPKKKITRQCPKRNRTADAIIARYLLNSGVTFTNEVGDRAFYRPATDSVTVPVMAQFKTTAEYYSTVFHELGHSTGHPSRENRFELGMVFGNEPYAREELVAEFTSAILCNYTEVGTEKSVKNSTAYIKNWSTAIKNDPKMFTVACYAADKAARRIIGGKIEKVVERTEAVA